MLIPHKFPIVQLINWLEAFILSRNLLLLHKQGIFYIHNYAHIIYNSGINSEMWNRWSLMSLVQIDKIQVIGNTWKIF